MASNLLRMGLAYGASYAAYAAGGGPRPFSAAFAVTNRCNLRCSYCNFPELDPRDLDLEATTKVLRRLADLGVVRLGLVGGEPLLRKDIGALVQRAKDNRFFVTLNSNLTLYQRHEAVFSDVDLVLTSLDGNAATHRENRGARSLDGVHEAIAALRKRRKAVVAICVVNELTLKDATSLLDTAERLDIKVHFQPQCMDTEIVRGSLSPAASNARLREFWEGLVRAKADGRPIASSSVYLEELSRWKDHFVSAYLDPHATCAAGRGFLFVDPQGNAYPCAYTKGKVSPVNLLDGDYRSSFTGSTPCTRCSVGPMLEANLLFQRPLASVADLVRSYR